MTKSRRRIQAMYAIIAVLNIGAWLWALLAFGADATLLGVAAMVYGLGLRHAVDPDHIAAIDNVTRKLMNDGQRPVGVGFFFAFGHSAVVLIICAVVASATTAISGFSAFREIGGLISTTVSATFLVVIAAANVVALPSLVRRFRQVRSGASSEDSHDTILHGSGLASRLVRSRVRLISTSWHMAPLGFLFGLSFDTATEIAMFGISASQLASGVPFWAMLVLPVLFAAAMSLVDTTDGVLMLGAYEWAFVDPARKLLYNITVTSVSVVVALVVAGIQMFDLVADRLALSGRFWDVLASANDHFDVLGIAIIAVFLGIWGASVVLHRAGELRGEVLRTAPSK